MSAEHGVPEHGVPDQGVPDHGAPLRWTRRRATIVVSAATVTAVAFAGTLALTGTFDPTHSPAAVKAPITAGWTSHATLTSALKAIAASAGSDPAYYAYVAASTGDEIIEVNVAKAAIVGEISADTADGVALTPNGATAYVTTETGIYEISTATSRVVRVIPDFASGGPQGITVSPNGATLYVTNPDAGTVIAIDAANGKITGSAAAGAEPEAVAVTPNGNTLYVADMNSDSVSVLSAATLLTTGTINVGRLPMSVTVSPDGSQVWVGNGFTGSVSIIATANNSIVATVGGGPGTSTLDAAITDIAFAPAP
jgi:YVTN family beta-propeller protein